jgi:hypothetical protein
MSQDDALPSSSWPSELRAEAKQIGKPEAVFTTANSDMRTDALIAIGMIVIGVVTNILYWFVLDLPQFWLLNRFLVVVGIILPFGGIYVLISALQHSDVWVLIYPMSIIYWKRASMMTIEWEEIRSITFSGVQTFEEPYIEREDSGKIRTAWLAVKKKLFFYWSLRIERKDGETAVISEHIRNSTELSKLIQERTFLVLWPLTLKRLKQDSDCKFGILRVTQNGIKDDKDDLIRWKEIGSVKTDKSLQIRKVDALHPWRTVFLWNLPNPHILLTLIATYQEWKKKGKKSEE